MRKQINPENFMRAEACMDRSGDDERHERLKDKLLEAAEIIAEMRQSIESAMSIFRECEVTTGVCCCGDYMEGHSEPMNCGHVPVDMGTNAVHIWAKHAEEKFGA